MQLKRLMTFLIGCIGLRIFIAYLAFLAGNNVNKLYINIMSYLALCVGLSLLIIYFKGSEVADKQLEIWDNDKKLWWNQLRLFHGIMYILFFVSSVFYNWANSYLFLSFDVFMAFFWLSHNIRGINFF